MNFVKHKIEQFCFPSWPGHQCSAVFKKWLPNTNYDNPANWDKGRLPCDSDDVQLDKVIIVSNYF